MNTNEHDNELCRILVADYLLKDKRFIPLYKEYVKYDPNDDVDHIVANIYVFIVNIEPSVIESNPEKAKEYVRSLLNRNALFKVNSGRNKCEKFEGVVIKMYNNVFTVLVNGILKSFSYNDVFIGDVMIKEK